jgi:hypothetical protein
MADRELEIVQDALREHVSALAVDIGPRTPLDGNTLVGAANYIHSVFEDSGLSVREQHYQYYDQRVTNVLATHPTATEAAYYVVGAHYDTVPGTPGADDNASAVAVMLELAQRLSHERLKAPVLFAAFTLEEPPAYLTGHQGSRKFVSNCRANGDRLLEWSASRRPGSTIHISPAGRVILPRETSLALLQTGVHGGSDVRF